MILMTYDDFKHRLDHFSNESVGHRGLQSWKSIDFFLVFIASFHEKQCNFSILCCCCLFGLKKRKETWHAFQTHWWVLGFRGLMHLVWPLMRHQHGKNKEIAPSTSSNAQMLDKIKYSLAQLATFKNGPCCQPSWENVARFCSVNLM